MTQQRNHKRSWKNLLINKEYQLRLTLVLVGVSAVLMAGLGWWVMDQAHTATQVAINNVEGTRCEKPAWMSEDGSRRVVVDEITAMEPSGTQVEPVDVAPAGGSKVAPKGGSKTDPGTAPESGTEVGDPMKGASSGGEKPPTGTKEDSEGEGEGEGASDAERERPRVTITSSDMKLEPQSETEGVGAEPGAAAPADLSEGEKKAQEKRYHECQLAKRTKVEDLRGGQALIFQVLIGLGVLLVLGLAIYGIKMTHKVAGPLFKVSLYLGKLRDGKYDTVYNLRKGDHLMEFYDHFKAAHAGVTEMQKEDVAMLKAAIEKAKAAGLADRSAELKASIARLESLLEDRESSIV